jgi:hypothetical protein
MHKRGDIYSSHYLYLYGLLLSLSLLVFSLLPIPSLYAIEMHMRIVNLNLYLYGWLLPLSLLVLSLLPVHPSIPLRCITEEICIVLSIYISMVCSSPSVCWFSPCYLSHPSIQLRCIRGEICIVRTIYISMVCCSPLSLLVLSLLPVRQGN